MRSVRNYQVKGIEHLLSHPHGRPHALLADEPGTGKTIMAIEAAKAAGCKTGIILCPAIIKEQWKRQMHDWGLAHPDEVQTVYGLEAEIDNRPWVIVNYDIIRDKKQEEKDGSKIIIPSRNRKQLRERKWHTLVMDEAHRLKTHDSAQTIAVLSKRYGIAENCYYKWAMSGTIVPNRPLELYPLLRCLAPEVLGKYDTHQKFIERYCGGSFMQGKGASNIEELTESLQKFMLRRQLRDVWRECPELLDNTVWLDVPYQNHPEWIGDEFMHEPTIRRIVAEAKVPYVAAYLEHRLTSGVDKLVCVTYHKAVIEQLSKQLAKFHPLKIYGGINAKKREESLAKFQQDPQHRLFLVQISSGGEAVDGLQHVASELVEAEPEWSPGKEDQAIARLLRFGQTKPVILTKLYAKESYEETIYWSNQDKREVIEVILKPNGGTFTDMYIEQRLESIEKKLDQILAGKQENFAPPVSAPTPAPISTPPTTTPAAPPVTAAPAAPAAPVSAPPAPVVAAPAASAPPAPPTATNLDPEKDAFHKAVQAELGKLGANGKKALDDINAKFGIEKLSLLPAEHRESFLGWAAYSAANNGVLPAA